MRYINNKENIEMIKNEPGIYFIFGKEQNPLYIGKSIMVRTRLENHLSGITELRDFKDSFREFEVKYVDERFLDHEERKAIQDMEPLLNKVRPDPYFREYSKECLYQFVTFKISEKHLLENISNQKSEFGKYVKNLIKDDILRKENGTREKPLEEIIADTVCNVLDAILEDKMNAVIDNYIRMQALSVNDIPKYELMLLNGTNGLKEFLERE